MLYPLAVSDESADLLDRSNYLYVKLGEWYYIVGEDALDLVNAIGKGEIIRPMRNGILNPSIKESSELLFFIIKAVVGDPIVKNEPLRFSCPGNPVDSEMDNIFHKVVLANFFKKIGYDAKPVNEAMCICYDCNPVIKNEKGDVPLSGISCSCGGGMWNLSLSYKGLSLVEFSCTKSGDYLDEEVSRVSGVPKNRVTVVKERKLDLGNVDMSDRVQTALSVYYDEMIERMVHHIKKQFADKSSEIDGKVEMVVAGGTSMPKGFCDRLEKILMDSEMPFPILRVRHSETPFYSVSQGACLRAQADYAKMKEKN